MVRASLIFLVAVKAMELVLLMANQFFLKILINSFLMKLTDLIHNQVDRFQIKIEKIGKTLLLEKNANYGNSALEPLGVFSKLNAAEAIMARIDDKLARISNKGLNDATEDTLDDLIGYLILLKIARGGASMEPKA